LKAASTHTNLNDSTPALLNTPTDSIPLKLALFNLSKYVNEEDFAVEFMLKGGVRTIMKLLEREEGGLSGNSLAVSHTHLRAFTLMYCSMLYKVYGGYWTSKRVGRIYPIKRLIGS
jgi:hypothetical protein